MVRTSCFAVAQDIRADYLYCNSRVVTEGQTIRARQVERYDRAIYTRRREEGRDSPTFRIGC